MGPIDQSSPGIPRERMGKKPVYSPQRILRGEVAANRDFPNFAIAGERQRDYTHCEFAEHTDHGPQSLSENSVGVLFSKERLDGEARRGRIPAEVSYRGATKPGGLFLENPPGGGSFVRGLRWLGRHSPLRGCSGLAALATAKIPRRRTPRNFQTGS